MPESFADFHTNRRHRGSGFTDTHSTYRRKRLNLVPDYAKVDAEKNQKIEKLKSNPGTVVCSPVDLQYIKDTFGIIPSRDKESTLGKTGIRMSFNPQYNTFILTK
tara:strand:+ start:145 stop:459 length:315 start_codon:yes stop_codon:yes gene_type:complete